MTKSELIRAIADRFPALTVGDASAAVDLILDEMTSSLAHGKRIEIRGFGSFDLNYRPPRVGRNPKSGGKIEVAGKHVPHFKVGKDLRARVDASVSVAGSESRACKLDDLLAQRDARTPSPRIS